MRDPWALRTDAEILDDVRTGIDSMNRTEDVHPKGAYLDGRKLALVGCYCAFCTSETLSRDRGRLDSRSL